MEIDEYIYRKPKEGQASDERHTDAEDKSRAAHALDTARYICLSLAGVDEREDPKPPGCAPGTWGSIDKHEEIFGADNPFLELLTVPAPPVVTDSDALRAIEDDLNA
jgi:hypothetical protein